MPTYDYRCEACGHEMELFQNISEAPKRKCPACKKSKLKRMIGGGAGFLFRGSGFYLTDYRSESYKQAASADSKPPSDSKPKDSSSGPAAGAGGTASASSEGKAKKRSEKKKP